MSVANRGQVSSDSTGWNRHRDGDYVKLSRKSPNKPSRSPQGWGRGGTAVYCRLSLRAILLTFIWIEMENTTQILLRQREAMSGRNVLVVDANDSALTSLDVDAQIHVHADDYAIGAQQWSPAPSIPEGVNLLVLPLPKSGDRLRFLLNWLAGKIEQPVEIWLTGPAKGGIKGALKHFDHHVEHRELVDSARHCKLYSGMLQPGASQNLSAWGEVIAVDLLEAESYPGVFSHGVWTRGPDCCSMPWQIIICPNPARWLMWVAGRGC